MNRRSLATVTALTLALAPALFAGDAHAQVPPAQTPTPTPAAPAPPAPPAPPVPSAVRVHLRTLKNKRTARLYVHRVDGTFALVCASPCTADLPGGSELRVTLGDDDDDPHTFALPTDAGLEIDLEVRPASAGPLIGSIVLLGSGGAFVLSGLLFIALSDFAGGSISASSASTSSAHKSISDTYKTTGYVMIGIGAAAAIAGLVWFVSRSHEPQVTEWPHQEPGGYSRRDALLGDVALAKPRDPTSAIDLVAAPVLPLHYGFAF